MGPSELLTSDVVLLQEVVSGISDSYSRSLFWRSNEALIVRLQAVSRGFLIRQKLEARQRYLISQTPAVIVIQVSTLLTVPQNGSRLDVAILYLFSSLKQVARFVLSLINLTFST